MNSKSPRLILASGSPRRRQLLTEAGLTFDIQPAQVEEVVNNTASPEENATQLARLKAEWVAKQHPCCFVLGADTLVALQGTLLGKPQDREDARRMLETLSGNRHQVITGMALVTPDGQALTEAVVSQVYFRKLTQEDIERYIETGEPLDKAGAYAIQGKGSALVEAHEGSFTNIVGLPMEETLDLLHSGGFPVPTDDL